MQIPTHSIATIPTKWIGKCDATTPSIFEVEIDEIIYIKNPQLVMLPTIHLKVEIEPEQVLLAFINLSNYTVQGS